jgi:hypothetical protein
MEIFSLILYFLISFLTAHASCLFKNKMWVLGGHGDTYPTYNLIESDKTADVWSSENMSNHLSGHPSY